jgi:hypothetical protein
LGIVGGEEAVSDMVLGDLPVVVPVRGIFLSVPFFLRGEVAVFWDFEAAVLCGFMEFL